MYQLKLNFAISDLCMVCGFNFASNSTITSKTIEYIIEGKIQNALMSHQGNLSFSNNGGGKKKKKTRNTDADENSRDD